MFANMSDDTKYWLGLSMVEGLGPRTFSKLYSHFGSAKSIWKASSRYLRGFGLLEKVGDALIRARGIIDLDKELARVVSCGVHLLRWDDGGYPPNLKYTANPPFLLYVKGRLLPQDNLALAVVGTRRCTAYGQRVTTEIVRDLVSSGMTIVSGMALGIDSFAHRAALSASGRTVAVCGCGLNRVYPPENRGLAQEIVRNGALVSEFPLNFPPTRGNFPARNRIISGLSLGVLVCEAPEKSGALITASCAAEQGRPVFAVPGSVFNHSSRGAGRLIQDGAKLVFDASDILVDLSRELRRVSRVTREFTPETTEEGEIFKILASGEPVHVDRLVRTSGLPTSLVLSTLTQLAMRGVVGEVGGGRWMVRN